MISLSQKRSYQLEILSRNNTENARYPTAHKHTEQSKALFPFPTEQIIMYKEILHRNRKVMKPSKSEMHAQRQYPVLTTCSMDQQ